jgi:thiol-disulfide isomerase/thioredoxin
MLLEASADGTDPESRRTITEVANSDAPDRIKARAKGMLHRIEALGKPFALTFTAVDGREVDLEKLKGKIVLIDLWATWCGPCVAALPKVKETYEKLRKLDFEIVGVSFDSDKEVLKKFVQAKEIPWPQYFDGEGWENKIGKEYGVSSIPSMWLIDRKGILRDLHAEINLAEKVEALAKE